MATTIAEALAGKRPMGSKARNESLEIVYAFVKLHMSEIDGARDMGYSWRQIQDACQEMLKENAKASQIIWGRDGNTINTCYRAVKNGIVPHYGRLFPAQRGKNASVKKYSVEVTEE